MREERATARRAGVMALALHTTGVLGRLYAETLENAPREPAQALQHRGARSRAAGHEAGPAGRSCRPNASSKPSTMQKNSPISASNSDELNRQAMARAATTARPCS